MSKEENLESELFHLLHKAVMLINEGREYDDNVVIPLTAREKYCHDFDEFGICIYCHCKAKDYEKDNRENAQAHGEVI